MSKDQKFIVDAQNSEIATVIITPLKDKIQYRVTNKIVTRDTKEAQESIKVLDATDILWNKIFGTTRIVKRFLKKGKEVRKSIQLSELGYDNCELVK